MTKPVKRIDLSKLTPEQREALGSFYRDCQQAAPQMAQMQQAAREVYKKWISAPTWEAVEGEKPERPLSQDLWHVKPEINYVDHIEGVS